MRAYRLHLVFAALVFFLFSSCKKETETFNSEPLADYLPLQPGKYITYQLDSTVFVSFGRIYEIHSYQEKHLVDAQFTDATGRPSYRIFRYLRDVQGTQPWAPAGAYVVTPTDKTVEVIENNLRFIKLAAPLRTGFTWKGNQYLPDEPYNSFYDFSNDDYMSKWEYKIDSTNAHFAYNGTMLNNVVKVVGIEEIRVADTVEVENNQAKISAAMKSVILKNLATDTITIQAAPPATAGTLTIYNRSSRAAKLDGIIIPQLGAKSFEYINNKWTFGYVNSLGVRKDTLYRDLPYGSKDIAIDKYAKGVGLVQQELTMWEYQANPGGSSAYYTGFAMKRTMIDHN